MPRMAVLLLAMAACWRSPPPPPPLRPYTGPQAAPPPLRVSWRGTCGDEDSGWREEIAVTLTIRDDGNHLVAAGRLAFAGRRT
jgi:hypothetical protein